MDPAWLRGCRRRGVTLVEMLVTLAVLLVMMTIIVQIFQAATGSLSGAQAFQELDNKLRQLDSTIRSDLRGVTARFTPPLDPKDNLGYFEYGENAFADIQGEDTDDYVRFTAKAPDGKPFTGRFWPMFIDANGNRKPHPNGPITITSQFAEIIYFLRNGNLYRRVFLVAPERQSSIVQMVGNVHYYGAQVPAPPYYWPANPSSNTSWQGVNDLSARPAASGSIYNPGGSVISPPRVIVLNTLGDLTNRENRAFSPRFANDFQFVDPGSGQPAQGPDNKVDDFNQDNGGNPVGDGVPDYYPTLYPGLWTSANRLIWEYTAANRFAIDAERMPFPYVYPGAYSMPEPGDASVATTGAFGNGWIHSPTPDPANPFLNTPFGVNPPTNALLYLMRLNHNPLDQGDNLPRPGQTAYQTWWGFPTWRETLSFNWKDPTRQVNDVWDQGQGAIVSQPNGLHPRTADALRPDYRVFNDINLLPPMTLTMSLDPSNYLRQTPQPFTDGWGEDATNNIRSAFWSQAVWDTSWEDDLIATGVRSFDVKAYDASLGQYVDLGWGDDLRMSTSYLGGTTNPPYPFPTSPPYLYGNFDFLTNQYNPSPQLYLNTTGTYFDLLGQTMAHEGRIPPLTTDFRFDSQFGPVSYPLYPAYPSGNVGDDNPGVIRLRRVWDSWSTAYSRVPANGIIGSDGFPWGPPLGPPIYPSYPPPYPAPLRGIQIQLRVVDPAGQRIKVLTIRQDFTDKL
jgi:prepilin-type N-terminal cleavage/methylation domain-containing protein